MKSRQRKNSENINLLSLTGKLYDSLIISFCFFMHRGRWKQHYWDPCGRALTEYRCDRTSRCHLHLYCNSMSLKKPFQSPVCFLPSKWEAVDLLASCWFSGHLMDVWGAQRNKPLRDMTQCDPTQHMTIQKNSTRSPQNGQTHQGWVHMGLQSLLKVVEAAIGVKCCLLAISK